MWPKFLSRRRTRRSAASLHARLTDRRRYEAQIDELHRRHLFTRRLYELRQDDVPLASVVLDKRRVAKLLSDAFVRGTYELECGRLNRIRVNGKERIVYAFRLTDLIVHRVVAAVVEEAMRPLLSPCLYSYRKGVSWWQPISAFASYVREHRRERPDPRTRGIYVLRRDIHSYTDSIPVHEGSPVWPMLRRALRGPVAGPDTPEIPEAAWRMVQEVVRPRLSEEPGCEFNLIRGVPTGQPISCLLFNLYLTDFDHQLDDIPGAFYARYSDDLLFAHPDPDVVREVSDRIDQQLAALDIQANRDKGENLYLNGAGRASAAWPEARGTTSVEFLGCHLAADGTVSLNRKKRRQFLRDIDERARRTARALQGQPEEQIGRAVCAVINQATHPRNNVFPQRSGALLRRAVTDRQQLGQLDYLVARIVAGVVSGDINVRSFRKVPYRRIRKQWQLQSLLHSRNTWPRRLRP
jgi:hypothetical protein